MTSEDDREKWHLDKRVPIALILTMLAGYAGGITWAAQIGSRLASIEKVTEATPSISDRLTRLEVNSDAVRASVGRIEARMEREEARHAR